MHWNWYCLVTGVYGAFSQNGIWTLRNALKFNYHRYIRGCVYLTPWCVTHYCEVPDSHGDVLSTLTWRDYGPGNESIGRKLGSTSKIIDSDEWTWPDLNINATLNTMMKWYSTSPSQPIIVLHNAGTRVSWWYIHKLWRSRIKWPGTGNQCVHVHKWYHMAMSPRPTFLVLNSIGGFECFQTPPSRIVHVRDYAWTTS